MDKKETCIKKNTVATEKNQTVNLSKKHFKRIGKSGRIL